MKTLVLSRGLSPALESMRLLDRARQFRQVAVSLHDMDGPEPNWPKWFLVTHAIELTIKAYIESRKDSAAIRPSGPEPANHDLVALYNYAVDYGLTRDPIVTKDLPHLSELHEVHYARYPQLQAKPVALIAQYDDMVDRLIADISVAARK
jgi:hypothetical protein